MRAPGLLFAEDIQIMSPAALGVDYCASIQHGIGIEVRGTSPTGCCNNITIIGLGGVYRFSHQGEVWVLAGGYLLDGGFPKRLQFTQACDINLDFFVLHSSLINEFLKTSAI